MARTYVCNVTPNNPDPRFINGWSPNDAPAPEPEPDADEPPEGGLSRPQLFADGNRFGTTHDVLGRGRASDGMLREALLGGVETNEPEPGEGPPEGGLSRPRLEFPDLRTRRA